MHIGLGRRL